MSAAFETIRLELEEGGAIALLTLHRPEVRNAIDRKMVGEIGHALDELALDPRARAIVFTGAGDKAFAAGADIAELKERGLYDALARINAALFRKIEEHPLPSIAAIKGYALGGGCELAMACDIRIAGQSAKLGQPEVALGILPGAGAIHRLPRLVGLGLAKDLVLTGRIVDAEEALRIGLVSRVFPDADLLAEARGLAKRIADQGPLAIRLAKVALNAAAGTAHAEDWIDAFGQAVLFESPDKHARMAAFLERKKGKE